MSNNSDKKSFWTTLPGILTAIAAILTAMVALTGFISPPPVISYFDSSPDTISPGNCSNLSWNVSDATSVTIDPEIGSVALTGTRVVSPAETTTYSLKVKNIFGKEESLSVRVFVQNVPEEDLPVIHYFVPTPININVGESSTLTWSVSDATSVTIDDEIGSVALTGIMLVSPTKTTTYTLTATNEAGNRFGLVKVIVKPKEMPVINVADRLDFKEVQLGETDEEDLTIDSIPPNDYEKLTVSFKPDAVGPQTGKLTITSNDPEHQIATVELRGSGALAILTPTQLTPADGSVFDHYPRTTTLKWTAVPGATSYTVEIDCYHCCQSGKWCTDVGETWKLVPNLKATSYTFNFVGAQPGRWRVWAVDASGQESPKTGWWEFRYTR
jgi:hypothetical protein